MTYFLNNHFHRKRGLKLGKLFYTWEIGLRIIFVHFGYQGAVDQRVDNVMYQILITIWQNKPRYPLDKTVYLVDNIIQTESTKLNLSVIEVCEEPLPHTLNFSLTENQTWLRQN